MTVRSFTPWATPRRRSDPGPETRDAIRAQMHADVDTICNHWPKIAALAEDRQLLNVTDAERLLTPGSAGETGGTIAMGVIEEQRNTVIQQTQAVAWTRALDNLLTDLTRSAQLTHIICPPPKKATKPGADRCVKCGQEIDPKALDGKANMVDGHRLHAKTCYLQVWRESKKQGTTLAFLVHQLAENVKTVETAGS